MNHGSVHPGWAIRATRARTLLPERPHVGALLNFYLLLLELQAPLYSPADAKRWLPIVGVVEPSSLPRFRLDLLPIDELAVRFGRFCQGVPGRAPEPIKRAARIMSKAAEQKQNMLLRAFLNGSDFRVESSELGCEPVPLAFLPRGFFMPIAEALLNEVKVPVGTAPMQACPMCGWPPQVSMLQDETGVQGNRRLVCSLCAATWSFPRSLCPACGQSGDNGLEFHVDDDFPHVRVEECKSCRRYLKTVDLRIAGHAVPLVDDLATPELDLWAVRRGLEKIAPNVLGL